jgi:DNA modification methylase
MRARGVIKELYRITKDGGVVVWVVGDATINGSETGTSFRQALYGIECGFHLHDTMIYRKKSTSAVGSNRAYLSAFEFMFIWSRGRPETVNLLIDRPNQEAGKVKNAARRARDGTREPPALHVVKPYGRRYNIWEYGKSSGWLEAQGHPAVFPQALARDHILSWSNEGDTVFDPFLGSGTTGKMALLNNRNFIGIERDPTYFAIAQERIDSAVPPLL